MNGDVLADDIAAADFDSAARPGPETQILRRAADDRAVPDEIIRPKPDRPFDDGVRLHDRSGPDLDFIADAGVGADLDPSRQPGRRTHDRGRNEFSQHAHFLEAEIGQPPLGRRADDKVIEQLDLEQLRRLAQASR